MVLNFSLSQSVKTSTLVRHRHHNSNSMSVMSVFTGVKARRGTRNCKCIAAVLLLWVILFFSQFGMHFALHHQHEVSSKTESEQHQHDQSTTFISSPPRKVRFFNTPASFQAPSSSSNQIVRDEEGGEQDNLYGDDKRIVHTGPNPLHN